MEKKKYVAYIRRSKKEQISTLGLEAQMAEVERYVYQNNGELIETFTEIESGTSSKLFKRIVIWKAIAACKANDAVLIIAKLDRLARDVEFTSRLLNTGVKFIACDIPVANEFTIHVMAAVAEQEAKRISERTRAALAAKKARGEKLGFHTHISNVPLSPYARQKALEAIKEKKANNHNNRIARNYAYKLQQEGSSLKLIANIMNCEGFLSPKGKSINAVTVHRWIEQAKQYERLLKQAQKDTQMFIGDAY
jgi:DNA invertase Pin-like site-specific DNA recombinase